MDDVRAVMDAVGSERAAVFGASEGGNMSIAFRRHLPATHDRALHLVGCFAKRIWSPDYPWAPKPEERERTDRGGRARIGAAGSIEHTAPSQMKIRQLTGTDS